MKKIDMSGQKFGRLTAIEPAGPKSWLCLCECGNRISVLTTNLRRDHTKSCGCMNDSDKSGMRFGRLLVIGRESNKIIGETSKRMWLCKCDCGKTKTIRGDYLRQGRTKSCGCLRAEITAARGSLRGEESTNWRGGKKLTGDGYVGVLVCSGKDGSQTKYKLEHRIVMEEHLGRPLLNSEHVHHKNGIRNHNTIENLELKVSPHGPKISVEDAIAWAKNILNLYEPQGYWPEEELCL